MLAVALGIISLVLVDGRRGVARADPLGTIEGVVRDQATRELLAGVTVIATSSALQGAQTAITDEHGRYRITGLPPGTYTLTFYYADETVERSGVLVSAGTTAHVVMELRMERAGGEAISIRESAPIIDPASTAQGITIDRSYVRSIPRPGRTYSGALAGSQGGPALTPPAGGTEAYARIDDNPYVSVASRPLSTFSIDVDTASYANVRRFLRGGTLPPEDAVRIEELVNYFRYDDPAPTDGAPLAITAEVGPSPWNPAFRLVRIGLRSPEIPAARVPPRNLVFLIDTSGSMEDPQKLPLLIRAMGLLVDQLRPQDRVSLVTYAGSAGIALRPTPGTRKADIRAALASLHAAGSTAGSEGIVTAYQLARDSFLRGGINRVILCTDGDFNVGLTDEGSLVRLIERERERGVLLSVLGFGMGNLKDATLEKLADRGNGNYAYIDSIAEARKALVEQAGATLVTVAKDVKIQVELNPVHVAGYRLIGYENRLLADEDFNDDTKDAGDLGAGHTVTALYEIVPAGQPVPSANVDALRYQTPRRPTAATAEMMTIKVRYKAPSGKTSKLLQRTVHHAVVPMDRTSNDFRWAAAVAGYGMMLRESPHRGALTWAKVRALAAGAIGRDPGGYRAELLRLVDRASGLKRP